MTLHIDTAIPGGNVTVLEIRHGRHALLHKNLRDTEGDWFYWGFAARFDRPGVYTFSFPSVFDGGAAIGTRGPAVSLDQGRTWRWLAGDAHDRTANYFNYTAAAPHTAWFNLAIQYQEDDWRRFLDDVASPAVAPGVLCQSRKGRAVETVRVGGGRRNLLLTSRHHCCEMAATHVLEGMLRETLDNAAVGAMFAVTAVPFVDKDGVVDGDQGKNRRPHDHARDYRDDAIYPETRAIMALAASEGFDAVVDLHCPWIYGEWNEVIYWVGKDRPGSEAMTRDLCRHIVAANDTGIPFDATSGLLPYGVGWNTGANYTKGATLPQWMGRDDRVRFAGSVEIPYANVGGFTLSREALLGFGRVLARALTVLAESW